MHYLEHHFAVTAYEEGRDIYKGSRLLGHAEVAVTKRDLKSLALL